MKSLLSLKHASKRLPNNYKDDGNQGSLITCLCLAFYEIFKDLCLPGYVPLLKTPSRTSVPYQVVGMEVCRVPRPFLVSSVVDHAVLHVLHVHTFQTLYSSSWLKCSPGWYCHSSLFYQKRLKWPAKCNLYVQLVEFS